MRVVSGGGLSNPSFHLCLLHPLRLKGSIGALQVTQRHLVVVDLTGKLRARVVQIALGGLHVETCRRSRFILGLEIGVVLRGGVHLRAQRLD